MVFLIGIPLILLLSFGVGAFTAKKFEDLGIGKVYAVLTFTLGMVVLVAIWFLRVA